MGKRIIVVKLHEMIKVIYGKTWVIWRNNIKYRERRVSKGSENPDSVFYVIPCLRRAAFFQHYNFILSHLFYAIENNYLPLIDMTDPKNVYKSSKPNMSDNVWEYYFEQPAKVGLKEIEKSKNIIFASNQIKTNPVEKIYINTQAQIKNISDFTFEHLRFNNSMQEHLNKQYDEVISRYNSKNILGVHIRGTDYNVLQPKNHSIQPNIEYSVATANRLIEEWDIDLIYICTEDQQLLESFKSKMSTKVTHTKSTRIVKYEFGKGDILEQLTNENEHKDGFDNGLEYITDIYLLSKCDYLLSGAGLMGTSIGILWNGGQYKDKHIMDLGVY